MQNKKEMNINFIVIVNKLIYSFIVCLSIVGCSSTIDLKDNKNESSSISFTGKIHYDSAYWSFDSIMVTNLSTNNNLPNDVELDSMENTNLEVNKQILKDIYIEYRKRNWDTEDPESCYYRNVEEFSKTNSAFLSCLYYYLYSHGYKKIDESLFKQKLHIFYFYDWRDFYKIGDFYGNYDRNKTITEDFSNTPSCVCTLENSVLYSRLDEKPIRVWITLDDEEGEKENDEVDVFGNTISHISIESLEKGILSIDKDLMDLDKLLYEHLYVFNDNKAAKIWLLNNRMEFFFYDLCFYDEDDEINRKKLRYLLKKCTYEGEVHAGGNFDLVGYSIAGLHNNMMKLIFEETDKAMTIYENGGEYDAKAFDLLYDYFNITYVTNEDSKKISDERKLEQLEKLCVFLKMESSLNKKHYKYNSSGWFNNSHALSIAYQCLDDTLIEVAKQHNYYNIPNFDEVLKVYEWDSENAYRDKSGIPFDYTTLLSE